METDELPDHNNSASAFRKPAAQTNNSTSSFVTSDQSFAAVASRIRGLP